MLGYAKLKNHAGMMLVGGYETLRALHDVIHKVVNVSALFREETQGDCLLGLAYKVRKAFEQQREILESPPHYDEIGQAEVVEAWRGLSCNPANVLERVESRTGLFLQLSEAERRACLGQLLASLDPMFEFWYERDRGVWRRGGSPETFDQISLLGELQRGSGGVR